MDDQPDAMAADVASHIRDRAYYLWLAGGMQHGRHDEYWEQACRDLADQPASQPDSPEEPAPDQPLGAKSIPLHIMAHIRNVGDADSDADGWAGQQHSGLSIEGLTLNAEIPITGITYQALWADALFSEPVTLGEFCGTRGLAKPMLGLFIAIDQTLAPSTSIQGEARFIDGSYVNRVQAGVLCKASSDAALEAVRLTLIQDPAA